MEYIIDEKNIGVRLDTYLANNDPEKTRSYIKNLIDDGKVTVNGKKVKAGYSLKNGDKVYVEDVKDITSEIVPEDIKLDIVYEDEDIIIVNKKKGMVVHPANGNYTGTMVNSLMHTHDGKLSAINGVVRPGIVHRIDKDTSGILVVAKNDKAHKILSEQFKEHSIKRKYIALVKGIVKEDEFSVDMPIGRSVKDRKKMAVTDKNSRNAVTHIKVLERYYNSKVTLIEATLETGRTHQIRVHMSYKGYPLVGDEVYGRKDSNFKVTGQMLHAKMLGFIHPTSNAYVEFKSKLPEEFESIISKLRKKETLN